MGRKVVLAVDGSKYGENAFTWYLNNFHHEGDEVHLCHVHDMSTVPVPFVVVEDPIIFPDDWEYSLRESFGSSKKLLEDYCKRLEDQSIACFGHLKSSHGSPGTEINKVIDEVHADVAVVGSRGLGAFRRTIMGSTSEYVLHHARCPVIIVKLQDDGHSSKSN